MEIKIKKLVIENFKKINFLEQEINGNDLNIIGKNEAGKSTVVDAFSWCLFEKNSLGASNFSIKPIDVNGNEAHNLNSVVEITFDIDGKEMKFKRNYHEVYKGKRGEELVFSGHETDCYVNDVPMKKNEYLTKVNSLSNGDEELFRMLTNVNYFNSMHWTKQREIIFKLVPNISDIEIIENNPGLEKLLDFLLTKSVDDLIKIAKDRIPLLEKKVGEIANRIDEVKRTKYSSLDDNYSDDANTKQIEETNKKFAEIEGKKATGNSGSKINEIEQSIFDMKKKVRELETEREEKVIKAEEFKRNQIRQIKKSKNDVDTEIIDLGLDKDSLKLRIDNGKKSIEDVKVRQDEIAKNGKEIAAKSFTEDKCASCGQVLPQEKLEELKKKFNLEKSEKLEHLRSDWQKENANIEKYQTAIINFEKQIKEIDEKLETKQNEARGIAKEIDELEKQPVAVDTKAIDEAIDKENARIETSQKALASMKSTDQVSIFDDTVKQLEKTRDYLMDKRAEYKLKLQNDERIKNLEKEQRTALSEKEEQIMIKTLCDKFTVAKSNYLEKRINSNFKVVKFKMFDRQINGGINETCVATVNGVPYPDVNVGGKIQAGLDIINTLQTIYGIKAPIFIDNAESVTDWYVDLNSQLIKLLAIPNTDLYFNIETETDMINKVNEEFIEEVQQ